VLRNTTTLKENEKERGKETKSESRLILQISNFFWREREREDVKLQVVKQRKIFLFFMFEDVIRLMGV